MMIQAAIDIQYRNQIIKNHSATHLLHKSLREVLGEHIHQAGSLVTPGRLRFDFSHFQATSDEELKEIEEKVNKRIWANIPVKIDYMDKKAANATGAMALFGEKYGDIVRVVQIGDSVELCGGCHVQNSAEIGLFKIVSETGIGAGVRRMEAITGENAFDFLQDKHQILIKAGDLLKVKAKEVPEKIKAVQEDLKTLDREREGLLAKIANQETEALRNKVVKKQGIQMLTAQVFVKDMNQMRNMIDYLKEKLSSVVILLAAENNGKVLLSAGVTNDLVQKGFHAGKLISTAAKITGGGGGGRADMAQAGGKDPTKIQAALGTLDDYVLKTMEK
jgi:alanyl-tRNA synthetase